MTWLVLRYWYRYHGARFQKWDLRAWYIKENQGHKIYRQRYRLKVQNKLDHHRFWYKHYCQLISAYGQQLS